MEFDPNNRIVMLCAQGMEMEGNNKPEEANKLFLQAWGEATDDFEKLTAAHYVARHQKTISEKLKWDETALNFALNIDDENIKSSLPSLYLNIARCYEDMGELKAAAEKYEAAKPYIPYLPDNGYGDMIKRGILNGVMRVNYNTN